MYKPTILDKILDRYNLNDAYKQVIKNKGAAGVDGMTIDELGGYLARNRDEIILEIRERRYKPQPVLRVEIPKPDGGIRLLGIPTVVDRVIHNRQYHKFLLLCLIDNSAITVTVLDQDDTQKWQYYKHWII